VAMYVNVTLVHSCNHCYHGNARNTEGTCMETKIQSIYCCTMYVIDNNM